MSNHPIVHVEFSAVDRVTAGKFYADIFGWHVQQMPEMDYATFETHEGVGGGFSPVGESNPAGTTMVHIGTDDIPATLAKIEQHGGKTLVPETEIPGIGWFALFSDLSGNVVGLYKALPQPG